MDTLVIAVLVALQVAALCFALFLFTRSISGVTYSEAKRLTRVVVNALMVFVMMGLIFYSYWPLFALFLVLLFFGAFL